MVRLLWFSLYAVDGAFTAWLTKEIVAGRVWPGWLVASALPTCFLWLWLAPSEKDTLAFAFITTDVAANLGCLVALAAMGETLGARALVGAALALVGIALMSR